MKSEIIRLLKRLFGRKPPPEAPPDRVSESVHTSGITPPEAPPDHVTTKAVATMETYLRGIMLHYGDAHFQGDTQARQILSVYSFGGITVLAMQHQMTQPQAHAVCLALFTRFLGFDPADAAARVQAVITGAPDRTSHLYGIIHRGADAFAHWQQHSDDAAARDFAEIMAHFQKPRT